jgi:hypothetical protein
MLRTKIILQFLGLGHQSILLLLIIPFDRQKNKTISHNDMYLNIKLTINTRITLTRDNVHCS